MCCTREDSSTCFRKHKYCIDVVGRIMPPSKDVHTLISKTCESVKLHGQEELRLQVELNLLISWSWGRDIVLNCLGGSNNHKSPYKLKRNAGKEEPGKEAGKEGLSLMEGRWRKLSWCQRKQEASRSWKRQGLWRVYPTASRRNAALVTPCF